MNGADPTNPYNQGTLNRSQNNGNGYGVNGVAPPPQYNGLAPPPQNNGFSSPNQNNGFGPPQNNSNNPLS